MDMIYHLPFRDWLELNTKVPPNTEEIAGADSGASDSGDSADVPTRHVRRRRG
jgi:hypothetical protein